VLQRRARDEAIQTFAYLYLPTAKSEDSSIAERATAPAQLEGRSARTPTPPGSAMLERRDDHATAEIGRAALVRSLRLGGLHVRGRRGGGWPRTGWPQPLAANGPHWHAGPQLEWPRPLPCARTDRHIGDWGVWRGRLGRRLSGGTFRFVRASAAAEDAQGRAGQCRK
jgi:hypothetical protein